MVTKGQLIAKANCQAVNSSKKQTNEFIFTTMRRVFVRILEEIGDTKKPFEITWPVEIKAKLVVQCGCIYTLYPQRTKILVLYDVPNETDII